MVGLVGPGGTAQPAALVLAEFAVGGGALGVGDGGGAEPAGADEFDDVAELVAVKPQPVDGAEIHDDAGAVGVVAAGHLLVAQRAAEVLDDGFAGAARWAEEVEHVGLRLRVGADAPEG